MKQKHFIIGVFSFLLFSAFTTYVVVTEDYLTSAPSDPSFSERIVYHGDEMHSLDNYFTNVVGNTTVVNDYNELMSDLETVIIEQVEYMQDQNISIEQVRQNPSILPINHKITDAQYTKVLNVINTTMPVASAELVESLNALEEYVDLARQTQYSKFEIFKDNTGINLLEDNIATGEEKGLQSKEAIRKLKDLLKVNVPVSEEEFSVYPNPLSGLSKISFISNLSGKTQFGLYDLRGRSITSSTKNLEDGAISIQVSEIFNSEELPKGIYILKINTPDGTEMSNKLIIK